MKAVLQKSFGRADTLYLGDQSTPTPGPGQVVVRVITTSVNRPDIIQREGNYPPPKGDSEVLGLEVAGSARETAALVAAQLIPPGSHGGNHWLRAAVHTPEDRLSHWACFQ